MPVSFALACSALIKKKHTSRKSGVMCRGAAMPQGIY
jgi:hypothetical protein